MSWEKINYVAQLKCPCGKGIIERKYYEKSDDWNRHESGIDSEVILCPNCSKKYHIEHIIKNYLCPKWVGDGIVDTTYCVPNGINLNEFDTKKRNSDMLYSFEEQIVCEFSKDELKYALNEMYIKKYSTRLSDNVSRRVMHCFELNFGTKRFSAFFETLEKIIARYDEYKTSYECTKKQIDCFEEKEQKRLAEEEEKFSEALSKSIILDFPNGKII